jgi:hypothetical protein
MGERRKPEGTTCMSDYGTPAPPPPEGQGLGQYSGMESMPGYQAPGASAPVAQPSSIATAVKLMYAGAALSVLGILSTFLFRDTIRDAVEKASNDAATKMTSTEIDAAVGLAIGFGVVAGLIGVALWVWMASFLLYRPESTQYYDAQSAPRV